MEQAILFDWCTRSVASQYRSRVVSVSLVSRPCPKCLKILQKLKSYRILYSQPVCLSSEGTKKIFGICMYVCMDSLFSYIVCFSLDICIKFDPFLHLTLLGAISISAMPQLQVSKRKDSPPYRHIHISVVPKAVGPLYLRRHQMKQPIDFSVSPT